MRKLLFVVLTSAGLVSVVSTAGAAPPGSNSTVVSVSGGAYGAWAEVRSDIPDLDTLDVPALLEAAAAEDEDAAAAALESAGIDPAAPQESAAEATGAEAVLFSNGPTPEVVLPPGGGGPFTDSLADFDVDGEILTGLLEVLTEGAVGPDGFAHSDATVAELDVFELLFADLIATSCDADLGGTTGATTLINAGGIISGPFPENPAPNTPSPFNIDVTFPVSPGVTLTVQYLTLLNEQFTNGNELTVNGMHTTLEILLDVEGEGTFELLGVEGIMSQSRCGVVPGQLPAPVGPLGPAPTSGGPVAASPTFTG